MWQYTPFTPALIVTAGACALLSLFVWRRRPAPGAQLAATAFLTTAAWNAGYALELSSVRLDDQQLWADVQYLFISAVPGLWLAFTLTYTGREQRLTRTVVGGLFVEPVITIALAWGSDVVPWLRAGAEQIVADGFVIVSWQYGPYFWVHTLYSYVLMLVATVLLVPVILRSPHLYRVQAATVTIGVLMPWIANAVYVMGWSPFPNLDLTPFSFFVLAAAVGWGIFRLQFLDVVPVARDSVVDGMQDGVIVVGVNGRVADINPAAERILRGPQDPVGRDAGELLPVLGALPPATVQVWEQREVEVEGEDGRMRVYELRVSPVRDVRGRLRGRLAMFHDLTERKHAEEERVRTQRLRATGELAAGIGHNLNNILVGILAPSQRLMEGSAERPRRDAGLILSAAERARDLVQRLNRGTGAVTPTIEAVDVAAVVTEAVEASRPRWQEEPRARGRSVVLETAIEETPPASCDATGLHDLILNLVFNAVDALPEGGTIRIEVGQEGQGVQVMVTDDGVGMEEDVRVRVFEPFFTTKVDVGSGLGLSTAYRSVLAWGGELEVESAPGVGTTFRLQLPAWLGVVRDRPSPVPEVAETPDLTARILIAEDEAIVSMVLADVITQLGHVVDVVEDGQQALVRLRSDDYDIAVLDLGIPLMTGDNVAKQARETDPTLCTVLMTGWPLEDSDPRLGPFDMWIQKPFDTRQATSILEQAVRLRASRLADD